MSSSGTSAATASTTKTNRAGAPLVGAVLRPGAVPSELLESRTSARGVRHDDLRTPALERKHVHAVYDTIAEHWS